MRDVFLDILKVYVKVLHDDLLFELKSFGIGDELLPLIESYPKKTQKKVV